MLLRVHAQLEQAVKGVWKVHDESVARDLCDVVECLTAIVTHAGILVRERSQNWGNNLAEKLLA